MMKIELADGTKITIDNDYVEDLVSKTITEEVEKVVFKESNFILEFEPDEDYYYIDCDGDVLTDNSIFNNMVRVDKANAFSNSEFAEKIEFKQRLERQLLRFRENNDTKDRAGSTFYTISVDTTGEIYADRWSCDKIQGVLEFNSEEVCEEAIEEFREDLVKYFNLGF